jgi:hypothetical protein
MPIIDRKESVAVLQECMDLQLKKSKDYQSDSSNVTQAMHYRRGVDTIHDIIIGKLMRHLQYRICVVKWTVNNLVEICLINQQLARMAVSLVLEERQ